MATLIRALNNMTERGDWPTRARIVSYTSFPFEYMSVSLHKYRDDELYNGQRRMTRQFSRNPNIHAFSFMHHRKAKRTENVDL